MMAQGGRLFQSGSNQVAPSNENGSVPFGMDTSVPSGGVKQYTLKPKQCSSSFETQHVSIGVPVSIPKARFHRSRSPNRNSAEEDLHDSTISKANSSDYERRNDGNDRSPHLRKVLRKLREQGLHDRTALCGFDIPPGANPFVGLTGEKSSTEQSRHTPDHMGQNL